jgi:hypothetical protein
MPNIIVLSMAFRLLTRDRREIATTLRKSANNEPGKSRGAVDQS